MRLAGVAAANHETAMGHALMITAQLVFADEVDGSVVVGEVVRHADDGLLHRRRIGTFGQHHEAFTGVLLACAQLGTRTAAHALDRLGRRQCVLHARLHPGNPAHGIGMTLAQSLAPEGVGHAIGQQRFAVQPIDGEHARVPADGDQRCLAVRPCRLVYGGEVFGNPRMGIEAVHGIEHRRQLRPLRRQVVLGAAAENQHIDGLLVFGQRIHRVHRRPWAERYEIGRGTAGENPHQRHVRVLRDRRLDAPPEVAVTGDADTNLLAHEKQLPIQCCTAAQGLRRTVHVSRRRAPAT